MVSVSKKEDGLKGAHNKPADNRRAMRRTVILIGLLLFLVALVYCFSTELIPSQSMLPTLKPGDQVLTLRAWIAYPHGSMPARGDIILFHTTGENGGQNGRAEASSARRIGVFRNEGDLLIKRVVGLPGETIDFRGDDIFVNGKKQPHDYEINPWTRDDNDGVFYNNGLPVTLGPDEVYVMGDNRDNSDDSRYWGPLKRTHITGKYLRILFHRNVKTETPQDEPQETQPPLPGRRMQIQAPRL